MLTSIEILWSVRGYPGLTCGSLRYMFLDGCRYFIGMGFIWCLVYCVDSGVSVVFVVSGASVEFVVWIFN